MHLRRARSRTGAYTVTLPEAILSRMSDARVLACRDRAAQRHATAYVLLSTAVLPMPALKHVEARRWSTFCTFQDECNRRGID